MWRFALLAFALLAAGRPARASADTDLIASRLRTDALASAPAANADIGTWLASQTAPGGWTDIDYVTTPVTGAARPLYHVRRLLGMALAYQRSGNPYYRSAAVLDAIARGLIFYVGANPYSGPGAAFENDWWDRQIGEGLELGPLLLVMRPVLRPAAGPAPLTAAQFQGAVNRLSSSTANKCYRQGTCTGENLVWVATTVIYRGCLESNDAWVAAAFADIERVATLTSATPQAREGIQYDYSFHQHGAQLYSGGYGAGFLENTSHWIYTARGTAFAFTSATLALVADLALDGHRWMMRGNMYDHSVVGREITRTAPAAPPARPPAWPAPPAPSKTWSMPAPLAQPRWRRCAPLSKARRLPRSAATATSGARTT